MTTFGDMAASLIGKKFGKLSPSHRKKISEADRIRTKADLEKKSKK